MLTSHFLLNLRHVEQQLQDDTLNSHSMALYSSDLKFSPFVDNMGEYVDNECNMVDPDMAWATAEYGAQEHAVECSTIGCSSDLSADSGTTMAHVSITDKTTASSSRVR